MANQYSSEKKTIGELLSLTSPNIVVPEWQRSFSWTTTEVEIFWQDLLAFSNLYPDNNITKQEYFLGSIVLVKGGAAHELLDGQQRLATATILLSVIKDFLRPYSENAATRTSNKYICEIDDATGEQSYKLTLNTYDRDFFREAIQNARSGNQNLPIPTHDSHRLLLGAREYFHNQFGKTYDQLGGGKPSYDWALRIRRILTDQMSVVAVSSADEDNAANVFETLNDRGIGLSTPDLLRNLLLRRAKPDQRDEILNCWDIVLQLEKKVEIFLRHFWLSRHGDVKTRALYREIKSHIVANDLGSLEMSRELKNDARLYSDLTTANHDEPCIKRLLFGVKMLNANSLYPLLLSAYAVGNNDQMKTVLRASIIYFTRHNVICNLENSLLESQVYVLAQHLRDNGDFQYITGKIQRVLPSDDGFEKKFQKAQLKRQMTARYLLQELELFKIHTMELSVELPDRVQIEHIYPQEPHKQDRWRDHDSLINRLGNLTLLAKRLNAAAKNGPFQKKKKFYADSKLELTKELLGYDSWDPSRIDERQARMARDALTIWGIS